MKGYLDFDKIRELSGRDGESGAIHRQIIKLQEEVGETSAAYLAYVGAGNASATSLNKDDLRMELLEEVLDTMIVGADLVNALSVPGDEKEVKDLADRKLLKWSSKLSNIEARKREARMMEFIK